MKTVTLQRIETSDQGTFGRITIGDLTLFTGELPWRDDENDISCIPAGTYDCVMSYSPHFRKQLYAVTGDVKRSGVRIHAANLFGNTDKGFKSQLLGCIALGEKRGWIGKQKCLFLSQSALRKFEKALNNEPFILEIKDVGIPS